LSQKEQLKSGDKDFAPYLSAQSTLSPHVKVTFENFLPELTLQAYKLRFNLDAGDGQIYDFDSVVASVG